MNRRIVRTKAEFIELIRSLSSDFESDRKNWENQDISSYLEAVAAYADDIHGMYKNMNIDENSEIPTWQLFSDILLGAKYYE